MESIMQYISVHWVSWVFGIISVLLSGAYHKLSKQLKAERARTNAINAGVLALLHDRLYQACTFYLKRKYNKFVEFEEYILNMTKRNHSFEIIDEVKNLYLKGISQKDIHLILAIPYSSVRNIVQRLRKLKKII